MSVALRLEDDIDVSRGDLICRAANRPVAARDVEAMVCWMSEEPLREGSRLLLKHTTRWADTTVESIRYRVDVETLHRDQTAAALELNDIARVHLRTASPLNVDDYRRNRATGSFVLVDETTNDTVGAGMITSTLTVEERRSPDVVWHQGAVDREGRWSRLGQRGATVWLTGLPASGKSTIAAALEARLIEQGRNAYLLDGDNLRHGLNGDLGFSAADRSENIRRTAHVARLLADSGTVAIVSLVSPYAADRDAARELHGDEGLDFVEVFVDTPLEECERRDPKGLYARARRGEISGFTGIDDPYEAPTAPDLVIRGGSVAEAADAIADLLQIAGDG
jgi:bifunctional enzyme CysN/CysC